MFRQLAEMGSGVSVARGRGLLGAMATRAGLKPKDWMPGYKSYRKFLTDFGLSVKKDEDKECSRKQAEAAQLQ